MNLEFKIIAPGGNELQVAESIPLGYTGKVLPKANIISGKAEFGELTFQNYIGDGFSIWFSNYDISHKTVLIGRGDLPLLELHMQFRNLFTTRWEGIGDCQIHQHNYNLTFVPHMNNTASFEAGKLYTTFDLHFEIPYLQRLAPSFPVLDKFLEQVIKNNPAKASAKDRFLPPAMIRMVNEIIHCPFQNGAASHFIECKAMEILLFALNDLSGNDASLLPKLSSRDIEALHEAKRLITDDFQSKMSLIQLSRKVYLNDNKLKSGFKYLFGKTVFEHLLDEKMKHAKQMLLDTEYSISHIAVLSGYESPSSFIKAFSKYYHVTPTYMRLHGHRDQLSGS